MDRKEYKQLVDKLTPKPKKTKNCLIAFLVGGFIGLLGEIITKIFQYHLDMPKDDAIIWMLILIIFLACLFTVLGFFDSWVSKAKAGIIIPITGFAHSITSEALDYKKDGLITGIGSNFFKLAGSVLLYGTASAFILVIIKVMIYG